MLLHVYSSAAKDSPSSSITFWWGVRGKIRTFQALCTHTLPHTHVHTHTYTHTQHHPCTLTIWLPSEHGAKGRRQYLHLAGIKTQVYTNTPCLINFANFPFYLGFLIHTPSPLMLPPSPPSPLLSDLHVLFSPHLAFQRERLLPGWNI